MNPTIDTRMWHPTQLPSQGRFYKTGKGEPQCPEGKVEYALWTTTQEEILIRFGGQDGFVDKMLIDNVRLPAGMKYEDLLIADQFYLLMLLRMESICPFFTYHVSCRQCKKDYPTQANLKELKVLDKNEVADEPFECFLPHKGVSLMLRYPRIKDQSALEKISKDKSKLSDAVRGEDGILRYQYARQIVTLDGQSVQFNELKDFVAGLAMLDLRAIQMVMEDNDIGYNLSWESKCSSCGADNESDLPLDESFFRPGRTDIEAAIRVARESRRRDKVSGS